MRASPPELRDLVEQALSAGLLRLNFPRRLEARFETETGAARCRQLQVISTIGLLLYGSLGIDDFMLIPDQARLATLVRFGVLAPLALCIIVFLGQNPPKFWREFVEAGISTAVSAAMIYFAVVSRSPHGSHYIDSVVLVVIFANVFAHLRFGYGAAFSGVIFLVFSFSVVLTSTMTAGVKVNAILLLAIAIVLTLIANYRLEHELRRAYLLTLREQLRTGDLSESNRMLEELSYRDALTGLGNRRFLERILAERWHEAMIAGQPIALLMFDVDCFKAYNDRYGHPAGDACLRAVAAILREQMRTELDLVVRFGGEEFLAVLPGQDSVAAIRVAERIRRAIEAAAMPHTGAPRPGIVTASAGVASAMPSASLTPAELIASADAALYAAKQGGRNRVWPPLAFAVPSVAGGASYG